MKIVFIITDYSGFNNFLGELAIKMSELNHSVHVICDKQKIINYEDKFPYQEKGIKFHWLNFTRDFDFFSKYKTSKEIHLIIDSIKPDIVNIHFTTGIFISILSGKIKYRTIGVFHGLNYPVAENKKDKIIYKIIETFSFKRIDQICLINNYDYETVKKIHPQKSYKYQSYGVGCNIEKFNSNIINKKIAESLKVEIGIQENDFVIMFTGRFVNFKGFDLLIRAFKILEIDYKIQNIKLILVGGKDPAHKTGLNKIEEKYYKNSKQIIDIGFTADVEKYLYISDLFVFPSKKEGIPVCIMEAIAMGVPTLTLNTRGCNDLIINDFNGVLINSDSSPTIIAKEILKLMKDKRRIQQLSTNCLSMRNKLDRNLFIDETIEIFNTFQPQ